MNVNELTALLIIGLIIAFCIWLYRRLRKPEVRLADLIEPKPKAENPFWMECFNKIKAKHIDFALADEDTSIVALIELDDSSHARPDRVERDDFVNAVLANTGYTLLRTYGELDVIEEYLR